MFLTIGLVFNCIVNMSSKRILKERIVQGLLLFTILCVISAGSANNYLVNATASSSSGGSSGSEGGSSGSEGGSSGSEGGSSGSEGGSTDGEAMP